MIISKDLFIFGEQIFATIIPEGGSMQGSQQQQQQQQQHQQQQTAAGITSQAPTATTTASLTLNTIGSLAVEQVQVPQQKKSIAASPIQIQAIPATASTIGTGTAAIVAAQSKLAKPVVAKQETIATVASAVTKKGKQLKETVEELNHNNNNKKKDKQLQLLQQQQQKSLNTELNGSAKLFTKKQRKGNQITTTTTTIATATASFGDQSNKHLEATFPKTASSQPMEIISHDNELELESLGVQELAEEEPLVKRNLTRILLDTTASITTTKTVTRPNTAVDIGATFTNFIGKQQQQRKENESFLPPVVATSQRSDCCLQLEAIESTPPSTPSTSTPLEESMMQVTGQARNRPGEHLSLNVDNVVLTNTSDEHTLAASQLIPEPHRTIQLTFQNITVIHKDRKILSDISGLVSPGEVLAIMGPSGCGKTTLLDCLSGQRRIDDGSIYLNREPISKKWRRKICYVLQEEIFFSGLTLKETVMYTALLRLPEKMPKDEKLKLVDRILETLELNFCQQTKFGDYLNRGLSGGEKKRANIACELLTNPLLMLLDEPTSGLDSHSAISLMKVLKRYAMLEQKTVVITVHQPSSQMFHMFDKLLLLYNGRTAYFGEVKNIYKYFEDIGVAIKPHYNPADFVLEQLKSFPDIREKLFVAAKESHGNFLNRNCITINNQHHHVRHHHNHRNRQDDIPHNHEHLDYKKNNGGFAVTLVNGKADVFPTPNTVCVHKDKANQHDTLINEIINNYYKDMQTNHRHHHETCEEAAQHLWCGADSHSNFSSTSSDCHQYDRSDDWLDYPTRFHTQFRVLSGRNFKEAKPRMLSKLNWFQTIGLALMAGAIWFQIPRTEEFLHDLQGWMFFSQTYWMLFALFGALNSFPSEREVISKERRSGAYRLSAYYLAKMCGELPLVVTLPTVYLIVSYPMLGCSSFKLFFLMLVFLLLNTIVAQSVGFFIGACCMDMNVSITLSALYTLATQLFGGYLSSRIPEGLSWIRYTSMIHYAYQNMQILEFREGPPILCGNPSSYEICKNSSTAFIPYEEILKAQNSTSPLWLNTLILMMFFLVFRGLGYAVLRYVRCPKT